MSFADIFRKTRWQALCHDAIDVERKSKFSVSVAGQCDLTNH